MGHCNVVLVGLAEIIEIIERVIAGAVGAGIKEALLISGWVLLWRPAELLMYDGIPWRRQRRVLRRLIGASFEIRTDASTQRGPSE